MRIGIIGAGKVATQLALAWRGCKDVEIVVIWSKTELSAKVLAEKVECAYVFGDFKLLPAADIYVVSVKDDTVAATVKEVHASQPQALLLHTAGSIPLSVFVEQGCERGGVMYPMQSFTKEKRVDFNMVSCFVESVQKDDLPVIKALASTLIPDAQVHELNSEERRRLHVAAVIVSNFVNHCCVMADEVLQSMNVPFEVMMPLLEETVEKLRLMTPQQAQTGPAIRGDKKVIEAHLKMLENLPDVQEIYALMSRNIQKNK